MYILEPGSSFLLPQMVTLEPHEDSSPDIRHKLDIQIYAIFINLKLLFTGRSENIRNDLGAKLLYLWKDQQSSQLL